jgi:hypothetical protein
MNGHPFIVCFENSVYRNAMVKTSYIVNGGVTTSKREQAMYLGVNQK